MWPQAVITSQIRIISSVFVLFSCEKSYLARPESRTYPPGHSAMPSWSARSTTPSRDGALDVGGLLKL